MPSGRTIPFLAYIAAMGWLLALIVLVILQAQGVLSGGASRLFTVLLIVLGISVPFAAISVLLWRRARDESELPVDGRCPRCRYDLSGLLAYGGVARYGRASKYIQCPECGGLVRIVPDQAPEEGTPPVPPPT